MKYFIKTFGCQMNVHESEKLAGALISLGYSEQANSPEQADIIIFNTCCIRDGVEQKIMGNIGALKKLKKINPNIIVAVCGCMSQADGRADIIRKKFPFVDIILGTHNIHELKNYILSFQENKKKITNVWETEKGIFEDVEIKRDNLFSNGWVNINYGCNNFCTYCIVPYVRGRERSRSVEDILNECKSLIDQGYKYITLLGQNVNSYGNDLQDKNINFAYLLEQVASLEGNFKIKFMTSHPKDLSLDVIKTIANNDKICNIIHLPIQSGSNSVLKSMNRRYTREHYLSLIQMIREYLPNAYISTDIIVGFPGETEEDFLDTCDIIEKVQYDGVFAFIYSRRSGTIADKMPNQISEDVKKDRIHRLLAKTKNITKQINKNSIGKIFNVIAVKQNNDYFETLSDCGKTIFLKENLLPNEFYKVKISKFENNKLYAELINNGD